MVVIFMAVAMFVLLRSENKKNTQTPPTDEPRLIPPVEMTVAPPPKERPEDALPSLPPVEDVAASPPKEIPKHELPAIPAIEIVAAPPPKERTRMKLQLSPRVISFLSVLAAILLFVLNMPILFLVALAVFFVVTFRRAGPISGWDVRQLASGFLGWFVINTLVSIWLLGGDWRGDPWGLVRGTILFSVNLLALLVVSFVRGQITLGVFLAILVNAIGYLLLVDLEEFGSFIVLPFYMHLFYLSL
jgi:hypothetical protein